MPRSPRINAVSWGCMDVQGLGRGKDFKLWPGGGREWDWRETGTHHLPGIQVADIEELLDHGCTHVVLSRGMLLALQTCSETLALLGKENITVRVEETRTAVSVYNEWVAGEQSAGGLFHSTC